MPTVLQERFNSIRTVRIFGKEDHEASVYNKLSQDIFVRLLCVPFACVFYIVLLIYILKKLYYFARVVIFFNLFIY